MKKKLKKAVIILCSIGLCLCAAVFLIDLYVVKSTEKNIISVSEANEITDADCILILGCGVLPSGRPSHMLEDRILRAVELYNGGAAEKIIASGDHGQEHYDETNTMKDFAIKKGVPSEDIFMDHAGFSTYESIYRAKEIFGVKKMIIVTQEYHLHRALYIAKRFGIEAYGVSANLREYAGQSYRDIREILARDKDFVYCIFKPEPTFLGEAISVNGSGDVTNDK